MRYHKLIYLIFCICLSYAANSLAAQSCGLVVSSLDFGVYDIFKTSPTDTTGSVKVSCNYNSSIDYQISISTGQSNSYATRKMSTSSSSNRMSYNLYLDSARSKIWQDSGSNQISASNVNCSTSSSCKYTIYGRVPALQTLSAGSYSDTLYVTLDLSDCPP